MFAGGSGTPRGAALAPGRSSHASPASAWAAGDGDAASEGFPAGPWGLCWKKHLIALEKSGKGKEMKGGDFP